MHRFSLLLPALAAGTLALLVAGVARQPWALALLGFQLPALWTVGALGGIFRSSRRGQPVQVGFYLALGLTLASYLYFAVAFSAMRAGR